MMIGREISQVYPPRPKAPPDGQPALEIEELTWQDRLRDISLTAAPGEIVGLGGLDGQGQRELLLALFGALRGGARCGPHRRQASAALQPGPGQGTA